MVDAFKNKNATILQMSAQTGANVKTGEDYPAYAKVCNVWKKRKIITVKQKQNISFPEYIPGQVVSGGYCTNYKK